MSRSGAAALDLTQRQGQRHHQNGFHEPRCSTRPALARREQFNQIPLWLSATHIDPPKFRAKLISAEAWSVFCGGIPS